LSGSAAAHAPLANSENSSTAYGSLNFIAVFLADSDRPIVVAWCETGSEIDASGKIPAA
jgi:hypothetical protein